MSMRLPIIVATVVTLLGSSIALAQDTLYTTSKKPAARKPVAKKAHARPAAQKVPAARGAASVPANKTRRGDTQSDTARTMAKIAAAEASCLRSAARHVQVAAQRLDLTHTPDRVKKARKDLAFAVGVMDECRNIANDRVENTMITNPDGPLHPPVKDKKPAPAGAVAASAKAPAPAKRKAVLASFGFGDIFVKGGRVDAGSLVKSLRKNSGSFMKCYEKALVRSPDLRGTVRLRMRMVRRKRGAGPSTVQIPDSSLGDQETHKCLAKALMHTPFPRNAAGSEVSMMMAFGHK